MFLQLTMYKLKLAQWLLPVLKQITEAETYFEAKLKLKRRNKNEKKKISLKRNELFGLSH